MANYYVVKRNDDSQDEQKYYTPQLGGNSLQPGDFCFISSFSANDTSKKKIISIREIENVENNNNEITIRFKNNKKEINPVIELSDFATLTLFKFNVNLANRAVRSVKVKDCPKDNNKLTVVKLELVQNFATIDDIATQLDPSNRMARKLRVCKNINVINNDENNLQIYKDDNGEFQIHESSFVDNEIKNGSADGKFKFAQKNYDRYDENTGNNLWKQINAFYSVDGQDFEELETTITSFYDLFCSSVTRDYQEEKFKKWLGKQKSEKTGNFYTQNTITQYSKALKKEYKVVFDDLDYNNVFDITDAEGFEDVKVAIKAKIESNDINDENNNLRSALDSYKKFLDSLSDADNYPEEKGKSIMSTKDKIDINIQNGNKQIIFTGAPGTGKTYSIKEYVKEKIRKYDDYKSDSSTDNEEKDKKYGAIYSDFVQFHPNYSYNDFIEGIKPIMISSGMSYVKVDGIFKAFCRKVVENNKKNENVNNKPLYYFIIDEINRADLSRVFGEIMFCLEESHRGEKETVKTQYQNLSTYDNNGNPLTNDVFKDGFYIPENIIILGSMNDIDRSVESIDFALRRRFIWINIKANDVMQNALSGMWNDSSKIVKQSELIKIIEDLNKIISKSGLGLDENYHIGPAYFKEPNDTESMEEYLTKIWNSRLESLLREYVRGRNKDSVENFIQKCKETLGIN